VIWMMLGCLATAAEPGPYAVVLGVAQDAGRPQAGCDKECCRTGSNRVASLGLVDGDTHYVIDATPDFVAQEASLPGALGGVFLTHAHMGHYTGLMHLGREAWGAAQVPVYAMPRMAGFLRDNGPWSQLVSLENIALVELADSAAVRLGRLTVTPFVVPHRDEFSETVGYRVEGPDSSLVWLPDIDKWERWATPIEEVVASVDVAYVDGTFYEDAELPNRDMSEIPHPFVVESVERLGDQGVVFMHLNHTNRLLREPELLDGTPHRVALEGEVHPL